MERFVYCVGTGSYSSAQIIGAFRTEKARTDWLERQAKRREIVIEIKYHDPSAPKPAGTFTTSPLGRIMSPEPSPPAYWYLRYNSDWISGLNEKYATQAEAEVFRAEVLAERVVPLTAFLPYWTQDVPYWRIDHVPSKDDD